MKTKIISFDLEMAKKIQSGEIEGKIKTKDGQKVLIVHWDKKDKDGYVILAIIDKPGTDLVVSYTRDGKIGYDEELDLVLEVHDNEPQFKPFDKVLVRMTPEYADNNAEADYWCPAIFQNYSNTDAFKDMDMIYHASGCYWNECIPYEGNEHLVGTTDKPKEE